MPGAPQTREALLDAGAVLAEEHGLAAASVKTVVSRTAALGLAEPSRPTPPEQRRSGGIEPG
jgi:hypothetical protein